LLTVWPAARDVVYRHPADLYALDAFGEIAAAAARVGDVDVARARLGELADVVDRLGTPPLWATPLSWARVEMAVANDDAAALGQEAAFLGSLDSTAVPRAGALGTAARAWSATAAGKVDAVTTEHGIASLLSLGMRWDAARLAGAAAARCDDAALARALLERARQLKVPVGQDAVVPVAVDGLSQREREVASLLVAGLTHKEIGAQLFISAKTVEHHAARIRQRLGAATRAELLAVLADAEAAAEPPADAGDALHSAGL
jgi:DNA-binding CsgD family transcriptional regulator